MVCNKLILAKQQQQQQQNKNKTTTKKYRIPKIESTELKKLNKLKCTTEDTLVPLGRKKKAFRSGEGKGKWMGGNLI